MRAHWPYDGTVRRFVVGLALLLLAGSTRAGEPVRFWDEQRKGANCQNRRVGPDYWKAAAEAGLGFVRLLPDAWPAAERDFLIGNADGFTRLNEEDLTVLLRALGDAEKAGVRVVLTMLSLPGARWRQLNRDRDDARLWHEMTFQAQATEFWRQLAARLRGHPAIAAYNPLNEPHPERAFGFETPDDEGFAEWMARATGTASDLNRFNRRMVAAIRSADPETPILLDGWFYASPEGLSRMEPVEANGVLYAFHFYEPWVYTTFRVNRGRFAYPDRMPGGREGSVSRWSVEVLRQRVAPVRRWSREHGVPSSRIVASEFGVDRRVLGAQQYLADLIPIFNESGWHWAFYTFRSDGDWTGLDYELGTDKVDPRIWDAEKRGEDPERYKRRHDNPLWQVVQRELTGRRPPLSTERPLGR